MTRPPGPAPITATRSVMSRTVAQVSIRLTDVPETSYAPCGDLSLAYQVFGDGPIELVWAGSFASHVELYWSMPEFAALMERLGTFCRILLFDKAGVGLSDPVPQVRTLDERATEVEAVMDAAGFGRAAILGVSEGGPAAILFAATRPERTRALILTGASAYSGWISWDDFERDPAELRARGLAEFDEKYVPSLEQVAGFQAFGRAVKAEWGSGKAAQCLLPSIKSMRQLGIFERMSASPGMARATLESAFHIDVRPILPTITVPTLVIHAREDPGVPVQAGALHRRPCRRRTHARTRWHRPRALVHRSRSDRSRDRGAPHRWPRGAPAIATRAAHCVVHRHRRVDRTAAATGDERWRAVLQRFGDITSQAAERFDGTVVKSTGEGTS